MNIYIKSPSHGSFFFTLDMHLVKETFPNFPSVLHVNSANYRLIDKAIKGHFFVR